MRPWLYIKLDLLLGMPSLVAVTKRICISTVESSGEARLRYINKEFSLTLGALSPVGASAGRNIFIPPCPHASEVLELAKSGFGL